MNVRIVGNSDLPPLICVPGLMGDISDFEFFLDAWKERFQVVLPNFAAAKKAAAAGYAMEDDNGSKRLLYENTPALLAAFVKEKFPGQKVFFSGISLGGKITLQVAGEFPEVFKAAVITDVGLGPLCESPLFDFMVNVVPNINMNQPWSSLRSELVEKIPDKMLRILVQSHLDFPDGPKGRVTWKSSSLDFPELVAGTSLENQWHLADKIQGPVHILTATVASGIAAQDLERMRSIPNLRFHMLEGANHFIQVYNREEFAQAHLELLK